MTWKAVRRHMDGGRQGCRNREGRLEKKLKEGIGKAGSMDGEGGMQGWERRETGNEKARLRDGEIGRNGLGRSEEGI